MQKNNGPRVSVGVGLLDLLALLFIGLKLGGVISWSWITVLSPIWAPLLVFVVLLVVLIITGVAE